MREVLIHLNVEVSDALSLPAASAMAVQIAIEAAQSSDEAFEELIALVDPQ